MPEEAREPEPMGTVLGRGRGSKGMVPGRGWGWTVTVLGQGREPRVMGLGREWGWTVTVLRRGWGPRVMVRGPGWGWTEIVLGRGEPAVVTELGGPGMTRAVRPPACHSSTTSRRSRPGAVRYLGAVLPPCPAGTRLRPGKAARPGCPDVRGSRRAGSE
ncbi:hypothetical protein GCM10022226_75760 [Sphaerisporangium flaviroseum]|uniref:Uncharacterized protein n=1 Tax=Sphaerisporangium flaviroseum TaxID=509199 RepID=A0ABP7JD40_9ACTN